LRQHEHSEDATFKVGPYTFKPASKSWSGMTTRRCVSRKRNGVIKFLYRSGEQIVGRDVLLHDVWGYNAGVDPYTEPISTVFAKN
jgi:DNA-binding response OmpR family regulator